MPRIVVRLTAFDDQHSGVAESNFVVGEAVTERLTASVLPFQDATEDDRCSALVQTMAERFREVVAHIDLELHNQLTIAEIGPVRSLAQEDRSGHSGLDDVRLMQGQIRSLVDEQRRLREAQTRFSRIENSPVNFQATRSEADFEPTDLVSECVGVGVALGLTETEAVSVLTSTYCSRCVNPGCTASNSRGPQPGGVRVEQEIPSWLGNGMTDGIASMTTAEKLAFMKAQAEPAPPTQPPTRFERKPVI